MGVFRQHIWIGEQVNYLAPENANPIYKIFKRCACEKYRTLVVRASSYLDIFGLIEIEEIFENLRFRQSDVEFATI